MIYTVIAKPTKACNADCSYCCAPPDDAGTWTFESFRQAFDRLSPKLADQAVWIWHGGEPMLLGPNFYRQAHEYATSKKPGLLFSMQTNITLYKSKRWRDVFQKIMQGRISTSFDPDEAHRTIQGDASLYSKTFWRQLERVMDDGIRPLVIGVYREETAGLAMSMYERSLARGDRGFHLRFNYCYPAGRNAGAGQTISPETYGRMLIELYDRWIRELPYFLITPLDQMFKLSTGIEPEGQCPWTRRCGGRFVSIEPNGDLYNCGEFADLSDPRYRFGNVFQGTTQTTHVVNFHRRLPDSEFAAAALSSPGARAMKRRVATLPFDCTTCRHFNECEGGCMRDAELYGRGLGGKFFYCKSWKMVFDRIKQSVLTGEADGAIRKFGFDPDQCRSFVISRARDLAILDFYKSASHADLGVH